MPPAVVDIQSTCTIKLIRLHYCQKADTVSKVHWLLCVLLILDLMTKPDSRSGKTVFNPPVATDMKWLQSTANLASFSTDSYLLGKEVTIGNLSIDNEMHDDDVRNPRRIQSRVSFLAGKRKVKQCDVLRRGRVLILRLVALAMAFKNVQNCF